jgi:hypothetical protein
MDCTQHDTKKLNQLHSFDGKFVWDALLERFGLTNLIYGSINAKYSNDFNGCFLSAPLCTEVKPTHPEDKRECYKYDNQLFQGHSGDNKVSQLDFAKLLLKQKVSIVILSGPFSQMLNEKVLKKMTGNVQCGEMKCGSMFLTTTTKEISLIFVLFPPYAVAYFQHHYWLYFESDKFDHTQNDIKPSTKNTIREAYKNTDYLVGKLRELLGKETELIFTTGRQEPYIKNEGHYYYIASRNLFFRQFNIQEIVMYRPVMAEQFRLETQDEDCAIELMKEISQHITDSHEYFNVGSNKWFLLNRETNILSVNCRCTKLVKYYASYFAEKLPSIQYIFNDSFYRISEVKTSMYNPVGLY